MKNARQIRPEGVFRGIGSKTVARVLDSRERCGLPIYAHGCPSIGEVQRRASSFNARRIAEAVLIEMGTI
jgi:hypothetical protein